MAKFFFGMNQSWTAMSTTQRLRRPPSSFVTSSSRLAASPAASTVARMYEVMRYWDEESADWGPDERDFAAAWRSQPNGSCRVRLKVRWPNATLISSDFEAAIRSSRPRSMATSTSRARYWHEAWGLRADRSIQHLSPPRRACSGKPFFAARDHGSGSQAASEWTAT